MKKNEIPVWTMLYVSLIVAVLISPPCAADNAATEPQDGKSELKALRKRCLELQAELQSSKSELETVRADFTQAYLALKRLRKEVEVLRTNAAQVLVEPNDFGNAKTLSRLVKDLEELHAIHADLLQQLDGAKRFLNTVLDVAGKEADAALRKALEGKFFLVERKLQEARLISRAPGRKPKTVPDSCRVLDVNAELGAVILDIGRENGSQIGSSWMIHTGRHHTLLQVVEIRPSLSAAVVIKGDIDTILAGSEATRWLKTRTKENE